MSDYLIDLPEFSGPLDLLLHLIDRSELDITAISLARVTAQYLAQIEALKESRLENLIDFVVVGARLMVIKSRALLPQEPNLAGDETEEEDPAAALLRQLRLYKQFKDGAAWLAQRERQGLRTYLRVAPPPRLEPKLDLSGVNVHTLAAALQEALSRDLQREDSVAIIQPRRMTIEDQLRKLRSRIQRGGRVSFGDLLSADVDRVEIAITLLAVLESIKRREVVAQQEYLFGPVEIIRARDAK